ncbi:hypothetical protein DFH08DRAFT_825829 [Mycena albidolilacea]|uniref:Uncharacterized protein n=1 Tax=Mycena albidolilacea TaxID=1033008 RepID=A0AAD6Z2B7_9AGAR|nr:hypothetical protein DFH08DRAFT_825829 [Mycena albidolilacea]
MSCGLSNDKPQWLVAGLLAAVSVLSAVARQIGYPELARISVAVIVTHINDTGQSIPGALVSLSTRYEHRRNDSEAAAEEMPGMSTDNGPQNELQPTTDNTQITLPVNAFQEVTDNIRILCMTLGVWLNLHVGISRENSGILLKAIQVIIAITINLIFRILHQARLNIVLPTIDIPTDIRTAYKQSGVEPEIICIPCCPTCFKPYLLENLPDVCDWKKSPRSWPCGTALKKQVFIQDRKTKIRKSKMTTDRGASGEIFSTGANQAE